MNRHADEVRFNALDLGVRSLHGDHPTRAIIQRAEAFHAFLTGRDEDEVIEAALALLESARPSRCSWDNREAEVHERDLARLASAVDARMDARRDLPQHEPDEDDEPSDGPRLEK